MQITSPDVKDGEMAYFAKDNWLNTHYENTINLKNLYQYRI